MYALSRVFRDPSTSSWFVASAFLAIPLSSVARAQCSDEVVMKVLDDGTSGPVLLTPKGAPVIDGDFSFRVFDAPPMEMGFLVYSAFENPVFDPMLGATIYPTPPLFSKQFSTNGQGKSGPLFNTAVVTDDLCGAFATFQAIVEDAGAPGGFAVSNAVRLRVGSVTQRQFGPEPLASDGTERPGGLTFGDMDEDGVRDVVSVSLEDSTAWVRPGLVGGGFGAGQKTALSDVGAGLYVEVGDFDGDAHLDLIRSVTGGLAVAFGNGAGGFIGEVLSSVTSPISRAHAADLNNDGNLDVVVARRGGGLNQNGKIVSVLLGTPSGFFAFPVSYVAAVAPANVAGVGADVQAGDLDEDGDLDLVVAIVLGESSGHVCKTSVLEGLGNGTFGSPTSYQDTTAPGSPTATQIASVVLADFDGDTLLDVATTFDANRRVYARLGNGDLSFDPVAEYAVGDGPNGVDVADVDDDGTVDLLVRNRVSADVSVLVGNGDGSFASSGTFGVFVDSSDVAVTDIDFDGRQDFAVSVGHGPESPPTDPFNDRILQVLGHGDGTFDAASRYLFAGTTAAIADFDGDGENDVLTGTESPGSLLLHLHDRDGTFGPASTVSTLDVVSAQAVELNGDAFIDLAVVQTNGTISVLPGRGDGTFDPELNAPISGGFILSDLDGDLVLDLVTSDDAAFDVALGNGDGTFSSPVTHALPEDPQAIAVGDMNGDTLNDVVYGYNQFLVGNKFGMRPGNGDGTFGPPVTLFVSIFSLGNGLNLVDIDGDGDRDVVSEYGGSVLRYANDGAGNLILAQSLDLEMCCPTRLAIADFEGDGDMDVLAWEDDFGELVLWEESGMLGSSTRFALGTGVEAIAVGDLDRDGIVDIAASDEFGAAGRLSIHFSRVGEY